MKHLRQYIRQILLIESYAKRQKAEEMIFTQPQQWRPDESDQGVYHKDYAETIAQQYKDNDAQQDYVNLRRNIKRYWNENADHDFWQSDKITIVHDLTYYEENDPEEYQDMSILDFVKKYTPGVKQKDEMSAYGFLDNRIAKKPSIGIILKGRVTYAANRDAWSESRSKMTKRDEQKYKSSGIPKRPGIANDFNPDSILFDEKDIRRDKIGELIVDNWTYDTVILNFEQAYKEKGIKHPKYRAKMKKKFARIKAELESMGLQVIGSK